MHPIIFLVIPATAIFCLYVIIHSLVMIFYVTQQHIRLRSMAKRQAAAHRERMLVDMERCN